MSRTAFTKEALLSAALAALAAGGAEASVASDLAALTGQRTRMVWIQGTGGQGHPFGPIYGWGVTNGFATIKLYRLVVLDTQEGAERVLQSEVDAYLMPMITPKGGRVIWTDTGQAQPEVWICDWDGSNKRKLLDAWQALGVAKDANGVEWVYVGEGAYSTNGYQYCRRYQIDNTAVSELVWDKTPTNDMWSVTPDGATAGMGFQDDRWTGPARLPNGAYTYAGQGCNCCISPDGTKYWHMEPDHKGIWVYDVAPNLSVSGRRYIDMHKAPGMGGGDMDMVWYAKWSEFDPLIFTVSGSHPSLGLQQSYGDVYVGKLDAGCTTVTAWVRVTSTSDQLETLPRIWTGTPETLPDSPPEITSVPPTTAFVGLEYSYEIRATGRPTPTVTVSGLPAWLAFSGGRISGTPGAGDIGMTGEITVTATSPAGTDSQSFQIEVRAENGLVGHWTFDDEQDPWRDESGLGNHGSAAGGTSRTASGRIGGAASFTGTSCVLVPDSPSLSMTGDMTAAAWFSFSSSGVHAANIVSKDYNSGWRFRAAFNPGSGFYGLECLIQAEGGWVTMPAGFALDTWYHVAVVFDAASAKKLFYVNGSLLGESQGTKGALPDTAGPLVIGAGLADGTEGWFGLLDDVRLYSRALGAGEIAALASGQGLQAPAITSTPPTTASVGSLYVYEIVATGSPAPALSVSGAPAWLALSGNVLSGTPSAPGSTGQITITATNAAGSAQQSFAITVVQPPSITILRPLAGEVWYVGTTRRICWTTVNLNDVAISYSTDGGGSWTQIEGAGSIYWNDPQWGSFPWQVPDAPSTDCVVNIRGYKFEDSENSPAFEIRAVVDSDQDGMDDGWETETFGDMSHDETTDADGDGLTDYEEFMGGTDPLSADGGRGGGGFSCARPERGPGRTGALAFIFAIALAEAVRRGALRSRAAPAGSPGLGKED